MLLFHNNRIGLLSLMAMTLIPTTTTRCHALLRSNDGRRHHRSMQETTHFEDIEIEDVSLCGCDSCYDKGFSGYIETRTGQVSCAQRIMQLIANENMPEEEACHQIAKTDHVDECASICDIDLCDGRGTLMNAKEKEPPREKTFCGCEGCHQDVWLSMAGEFSCGARVTWLVGRGSTSAEACHTVAGLEFVDICGACDPATCQPATRPDGAMNDETDGFLPSSVITVELPEPPKLEDIPLTADFPLYCFPHYNDRVRYENVWGKYTIEVKESVHPCGPSDNLFSRSTVQLENDELTLQFRQVGDTWEGSEVRVLLPQEEMPFHYGEYSFSVKSVKVIDSASGEVVDTVLPVTMILGLFTWDATESYAIHVDIEISRWNTEGLADVQYLVQPPGDPHKYRFFSGEGDTYRQAPHTYTFDWRPAEIEWTSSAGGGGHRFTYDAQMALDAFAPFYVQCMPADVEVRLNLWNLFGTAKPTGLEEGQIVEVVIDRFDFTPNGLTGVQEGGTCTQDCHCEENAVCLGNRCFSAEPTFGGSPQPQPEAAKPPVTPGSTAVTAATAHEQSQSESSHEVQPEGQSEYQSTPETNVTKAADTSRQSGQSKSGKSFLAVFFVAVVLAVALFIYIRRRRNEASRSRVIIFSNDDTSTKDRVVECWEHDTADIYSNSSLASLDMAVPTKERFFQR